MSSTPNPNIPIVLKIATDLIVGAIIRNAGDAAAQAKKAQEVIDVGAALTQINSGDVTPGLAALDSALSVSSSDPAQASVIQTAIGWIAVKLAALQGVASGTILGTINTQALNGAIAEATALAQKYIPAAAAK